MRLIIPVIVLISVCLLSYIIVEEDVITWSKGRPLSWSDYKGKPQPRFAAASTVYSLNRAIEKNGAETVASIKALFYCKDSWKKTAWINDEVLAHEQKHFDIVELFARRFRKQMSELVFTGFKDAEAKLDSIYAIINKEMDAYQDKYDDDTDGSMNGDQQRIWEKKISKEIAGLDQFENTSVRLKVHSAGTD